MIVAYKSNLETNKACFNNSKNISFNLNFIYLRDFDVYIKLVKFIKEFSSKLLIYKGCNQSHVDFTASINIFIEEFKLLNTINDNTILQICENIFKNVKSIVHFLRNSDKSNISDIRGVLTEGVATSFVKDVRHQNNDFIWDAKFKEDNNELSNIYEGKKGETVDIYHKRDSIFLCECKTTPLQEKHRYQIEFMNFIADKLLTDYEVTKSTFILMPKSTMNPDIKTYLDSCNVSTLTIEDISENLLS